MPPPRLPVLQLRQSARSAQKPSDPRIRRAFSKGHAIPRPRGVTWRSLLLRSAVNERQNVPHQGETRALATGRISEARSVHPESASDYDVRRRRPPREMLPVPSGKKQLGGHDGGRVQEKKTGSAIQRRPSLVEELFPELAIKEIPPDNQPSKERSIPRLELPDRPLQAQQPDQETGQEHMMGALASRGDQTTVMILWNAPPSLMEADFRRLVPKGKHIEEWRLEGDMEQVIPARDPVSLERLDHYYLIFPSFAAAQAYSNRVSRALNLAKLYTPTSLNSPLPPPPGLTDHGEDAYTILQSFHLFPHSLGLNRDVFFANSPPRNSKLTDMIKRGGYVGIVDEPENRTYKVLVHVEGEPIAFDMIQTAIAKDGKSRGLDWDLVDNFINTLATLTKRTAEGTSQAAQEFRFKTMNRFIVTFKTESEASRFAASWHRQLLPGVTFDSLVEQPPIVNTEVLW